MNYNLKYLQEFFVIMMSHNQNSQMLGSAQSVCCYKMGRPRERGGLGDNPRPSTVYTLYNL